MKSCFYEGHVLHKRTSPQFHQFEYPLSFIYLDLDELDKIFRLSPFWSLEKLNLATFRRKDHLGDLQKPLKECVTNLVEQKIDKKTTGRIQLMTHPAYFGYCFNPVSFYFCRQQDTDELEAIVVEINNTPWGEQYCYVIDVESIKKTDLIIRQNLSKKFHISPFFPMDMTYKWTFSNPEKKFFVHMENWQGDDKVFSATMNLEQRPITAQSLNHILFKYPFMTAQVTFGIYWQALRLWLKKIPFYAHPKYQKTGETHA